MSLKMKNFSIIGAGKVGLNLGYALARRGFSLKKISDCLPERARKARLIIGQGQATSNNRIAAAAAEIIFICVPDDQVPRIVKEISMNDFQGKFVYHTSGVLSSKVLLPLSKKGGRVASFHPIQTFALKEPDPKIFKGIFFGLEGEPEALKLGLYLVRELSGQALIISPENKPIYHLACSLSSNFLVVLLNEVKNLLESLGLNEELALEVVTPLINKTLHNVKKLGIESSLTGPIIRGDKKTVQKHLAIARNRPALDRIYRAMALEALSIARKRELPPDKIKALKQLLVRK
jgi:predicted short-subunit dehydrogenase-like oxidoreductase (DUF2520 family)